MADSSMQELLSRLAGRGGENATSDSWAAVEATTPDHDRAKSEAAAHAERERQEKLDQLLGRIARLTGQEALRQGSRCRTQRPPAPTRNFFRKSPNRFVTRGLAESEVESLILKFLLARGDATGAKFPIKSSSPLGSSKSSCGR